MTEPFRPDDDLVSAVLDGEATPEERARVEGDPVLSARMAEFTAVRDAVAAPVAALPDARRERAIAAAKVAIRHHGEPTGTVRPLRRRRPDVPRLLAVAAGILVVVLGVGLLANTSGDDSGEDSAAGGDDATTSAERLEDSGGDAAEGGEGGATADEGPDYLSAIEGADLGDVEDEAQLATALSERDAALDPAESAAETPPSTVALPQADVEATTQGVADACQVGLVEADPRLTGLLAEATVRYNGEPAVVYVYSTPEGRQRVVVVTAEGCRTLAAFDL
jgi:hypothetical protein